MFQWYITFLLFHLLEYCQNGFCAAIPPECICMFKLEMLYLYKTYCLRHPWLCSNLKCFICIKLTVSDIHDCLWNLFCFRKNKYFISEKRSLSTGDAWPMCGIEIVFMATEPGSQLVFSRPDLSKIWWTLPARPFLPKTLSQKVTALLSLLPLQRQFDVVVGLGQSGT